MLSFSIAVAKVKDLWKGSLERVQYFWIRLVVGLDPEARIWFQLRRGGAFFYLYGLSQPSMGYMLLLVSRPLPRDGGMTEDHGAPQAGQLHRVWTRGRRDTESRQRVSGAKSP